MRLDKSDDEWADSVGKMPATIFIACLGALSYGFLLPLVIG
ncbi:MAG TPA: hypothetical protein VFB29_06515 [Pseudolabrys sp.]|nr:hypothetical protein [Pseudolabrys sp.]